MRMLLALIISLFSINSFGNETVNFNGKINDSLITASITISENKTISGYYYYNKFKTKIPLVGEFVKDEWGEYWKKIILKSVDEELGEALGGFAFIKRDQLFAG